jgi:hypothetical protein
MCKRCLRQVPDTRELVERCFVPVKKRAPLERGARFNKRFLETSDFASVESDNNPGSDLSLFNIAQYDHLNPAQLAETKNRLWPGKTGHCRHKAAHCQRTGQLQGERLNRLPSMTEKARVARLDPHCAVLTRLSMRLRVFSMRVVAHGPLRAVCTMLLRRKNEKLQRQHGFRKIGPQKWNVWLFPRTFLGASNHTPERSNISFLSEVLGSC